MSVISNASWLGSIFLLDSVKYSLFFLFFIPPPDIRGAITFELPLISLNSGSPGASRARRSNFYRRVINVGRLTLNLADSEKFTAHIPLINRWINPGISRYQLSPWRFPRAVSRESDTNTRKESSKVKDRDGSKWNEVDEDKRIEKRNIRVRSRVIVAV